MADRETLGITDAEAAARLAADGPNELPTRGKSSLLALLVDVLKEPMILLLVATAGVYLLIGDLSEAIALAVSVFVVVGISLAQGRKTERALEALRDVASPRALVVRSGVEKRIAGRDVVKGDVVVLVEGDRVPADGVVVSGASLMVDESLLTGESAPVRKDASEPPRAPGGEASSSVFSGTLVVRGHGLARIEATGASTSLGRIGRALVSVVPEETALQRVTARLVRLLAIFGFAACAAVVLLYGIGRGQWLQGFLAGLALALSLLPEEFPVILTVFLALGAWRISRRKVLTRRMPALEALGAVSVLCADKTGTLTQNRMTVGVLSAGGARWDVRRRAGEPLPEDFHELLEFANLASQEVSFDPMDLAIAGVTKELLGGTEHIHREWELVREYPLTRSILAVAHVWKGRGDGGLTVATKGAPEAIADLCHLAPADADALLADAAVSAAQGYRVLAVARGRFPQSALPEGAHDFDFTPVGLLGLLDPMRDTVPAAMAECAAAGIRTVMITGDAPGTARAIAKEAGFPEDAPLLTGPELDAMDDAALSRAVKATRVFARTVPEQKLRLVQAFRTSGEVVAMTGDGVNDAPALRAADVGIAMGERGTDVAREAASLVVLDDDFSSIVAAVRLGRRVYDNVKKAMSYVLAVHVPIAALSLVPVLLGWPLLLMPIHIVFLELIIDPACSIAFESEPEDPDVMRRPPRDPRGSPLREWRIGVSLLQGAWASVLVFGVLAWGVSRRLPDGETRALAFSAFVLLNLALILSSRAPKGTSLSSLRTPNRAFAVVAAGALLLLAVAQAVPQLREIFRFAPLSPTELLALGVVAVAGAAGFDALKRIRSSRPA